MENTTMNTLTHPTILAAVLVGAAVLVLLYILKLIRKDENVVVQKPKNEIPSHSEKRKDALHSGKTKKKVAESKWTSRNEKQAYSHSWLLTSLKGHTGSILDMDYSSNGKYLTSCGDEDPDPGGLASSESSSSSSECNKENSRSPSVENSPRSKQGLSRRQRKNRRREPPAAEKAKKALTKKPSEPNAKKVMQANRVRQFDKFPAPPDIFEKLLRTYMLAPDQMLMHSYPVQTTYYQGSVIIFKIPRLPVPYKKTKFDVNAREFVPKHDLADSGQGSSSSSDSGESLDNEETSNVPEELVPPQPIPQLHKSNTWPMAGAPRYERTCVRCGKFFYTTANKYLTTEGCCYHWGRLRTVYYTSEKGHGSQKEYNCCEGREGSPGCTGAPLHVWNGVVAGANGPYEDFVRTIPGRRRSNDGSYGVFAVDCEMCYTVRGLECTKVTVVNVEGHIVYDTFVRPDHEIVDYNTRFSGITPRHLSGRVKRLRQVQGELLRIINENAVLIGHGLENDLRALRIVHGNVVDTAHTFPHLKGLPFRRSLKSLASSILDQQIQCSEMGHDSYEDARTCMELMLWRVRKDFRDYLESRVPVTAHQ